MPQRSLECKTFPYFIALQLRAPTDDLDPRREGFARRNALWKCKAFPYCIAFRRGSAHLTDDLVDALREAFARRNALWKCKAFPY